MPPVPESLRSEIDALPTKSAKIRALDERGFARADIARFLDIRYQHVRNVLEDEQRRRPSGAAGSAAIGGAGDPSAAAVELTVDPQGRIQLPPEVRDAILLGTDGRISGRVEDGELHLITPRAALRKLRRIARRLVPDGMTVVDEFIAEKRREAEAE